VCHIGVFTQKGRGLSYTSRRCRDQVFAGAGAVLSVLDVATGVASNVTLPEFWDLDFVHR
jgi:acyl-coenzyme A thioesterase PaaI-like protein